MPWYLVFDDDKGKMCQRGPYRDEDRAQKHLDRLDRPGKLYDLPTTDTNEATKMIKEKQVRPVRRGFVR